MDKPKFTVKKAKDGQFYFTLQALNGEVIATSEMYKTKDGAMQGIISIKTNAPKAITVIDIE